MWGLYLGSPGNCPKAQSCGTILHSGSGQEREARQGPLCLQEWIPGQVSQSAIPRDNHLLRITKAERVRAVILPSAGAGRPHWRERPCDLKSPLPRSGSSLTARCIPGTSSGARSS